jgi:bifunctional enzyme CysN/CysC
MSHHDLLDTDILTYLKRHESKDLLRFVAVGSVDDGKSTLIGRLLHDTKNIFEDQMHDARSTSGDGTVDLARLTDGLRAEREQGITIDVAYRYFTTARRKFIIADTPGHIQYTRNMATGASTADVAITLIDARYGVLQQSKRHAFIASLLGISRLVVAVNKMDLVDFDQATYDRIVADFRSFSGGLGFDEIRFFPISALNGDNVVTASERAPWYHDGTLLEYLEAVPVENRREHLPFRFPVQYVIRPHLDYRGFAGQVASGVVRKGDTIVVQPSGRTSKVRAIDTYDGEIDEAFPPLGVVIRLEDEIDISRGDVISHVATPPRVDRNIEAMVVWMNEQPLDPSRAYLIKHASRYVRTDIRSIEYRVNLETMENESSDMLHLNDIGRVRFTTHRPLYFDAYVDNRATGAFIIIDTMSNNTVGAGMIQHARDAGATGSSLDVRTQISTTERSAKLGFTARTVWLHGSSADTLAAVAYDVEKALFAQGVLPTVVEVRDPNLHRADSLPQQEAIEVAARLNDAGVFVVVASGASNRVERDDARLRIGDDRYIDMAVAADAEIADAVANVLRMIRSRLA